jgi:hypothetical protein
MSHVLLLGANGSVARVLTDLCLKETDARLTLYLRNSRRLPNVVSRRSAAALARSPESEVRGSLGVSKSE